MTQFSAIWVRCPKCWNISLINTETIGIDNYILTHICTCGKDITKTAKETLKDHMRFKTIISLLDHKFPEDSKAIMKLLDLYDKVVIGK